MFSNVNVLVLPNKEKVFRFSDILELIKQYKDDYYIPNVSANAKNIPSNMIFRKSKRGAGSSIHISSNGLIIWMSTRRFLPFEFKNELLSFLKVNDNANNFNSLEGVLTNLVIDFCKEMLPNLDIKVQTNVLTKYTVDILINDKIVIEIDEGHHKNKNILYSDNIKDNDLYDNGFKLIRLDCQLSFGKSLAHTYKTIKQYLM